MARIGVYLRISEDRDGQQTATDRQREDCLRFAASRGWEITDVSEDVDFSAYKRGVRRPEFERMLEAVHSGAIDGVLSWKLDRISRRMRELVRLDEACVDAGRALDGLERHAPRCSLHLRGAIALGPAKPLAYRPEQAMRWNTD
ncbi:MAG: recombinase family protein [Chloroflexi bacterium]|nr:recombinase family protein [Chloroflexota bacterium]